jgi:hypothetical protein
MKSKRHAKPTAQTLAERSYRHVLALRTTLLNQMALIRLDIVTARREDREHMKTLADHCARLLREKETLQRRLYAVQELKEPFSPAAIKDGTYKSLYCVKYERHRTGIKCDECGLTPWIDGARI